ncbi:MAG TPA: cyclopropane fatty acyl phospholipid synthase [Ilumatobacter sp.]
MSRLRAHFERLIEPADIRLGGDRPWDVRVHDDRLFQRVLTAGTLGLGEAYMDGWWDCDAIDQMIDRAHRSEIARRLVSPATLVRVAEARIRNLQAGRRAFEVGERHYDIGNDLYARMLGTPMVYSCAYWRDADDLSAAQTAKLELIRNKLAVEPGMRVLDIGCGWGAAARYFAERAGCEVVGLTVSNEQAHHARQLCDGLPVEIRVQDYREIDEPFDRVFSIGMFEHVGVKNYRTYMETVRRCLRSPDGLTVLHTIGGNRSSARTDPWMDRYIFPNSMLPSASQITAAAEGVLTLEDWHNFGPDYDRTLMAWHRNATAAWDDLPAVYDERFRRMWDFYLLVSAGGFRARYLQLWQAVFSRDGLAHVYAPPGVR